MAVPVQFSVLIPYYP